MTKPIKFSLIRIPAGKFFHPDPRYKKVMVSEQQAEKIQKGQDDAARKASRVR